MTSPRITLRVSDTLRTRLEATAHQQGTTVSAIARQWLASPRVAPPTPAHTREDCAAALVQYCLPEVRDDLQAHAVRMGVALEDVVRAILHGGLRTQPGGTRVTPKPLW
jgi:predicted transcriptional regulator